MTPKEKAEELFNMFIIIDDLSDSTGNSLYFNAHAKQCALIAVDEIVLELEYHQRHPETKDMMIKIRISQAFQYWKAVKQEIEKL